MSEKRQCEALAQSIVDQFPETAIKEVVQTAREEDVSTQEQFENVFASGVFEGARIAYESMIPASEEIDALLKDAIAGCDAAMQLTDDTDAQVAIAAIRRPFALFLQEQNRRMRELLANRLAEHASISPEVILDNTPASQYPEDEMVMLGLRLSITEPQFFGAFILWHDDTSMQCRCGGHLLERFDKERPSAERVKSEAERKFGNPNRALAAFGRWRIESMRRIVAQQDDHFSDVSRVSPTEAEQMAKQAIVKIAGRDHDSK